MSAFSAEPDHFVIGSGVSGSPGHDQRRATQEPTSFAPRGLFGAYVQQCSGRCDLARPARRPPHHRQRRSGGASSVRRERCLRLAIGRKLLVNRSVRDRQFPPRPCQGQVFGDPWDERATRRLDPGAGDDHSRHRTHHGRYGVSLLDRGHRVRSRRSRDVVCCRARMSARYPTKPGRSDCRAPGSSIHRHLARTWCAWCTRSGARSIAPNGWARLARRDRWAAPAHATPVAGNVGGGSPALPAASAALVGRASPSGSTPGHGAYHEGAGARSTHDHRRASARHPRRQARGYRPAACEGQRRGNRLVR